MKCSKCDYDLILDEQENVIYCPNCKTKYKAPEKNNEESSIKNIAKGFTNSLVSKIEDQKNIAKIGPIFINTQNNTFTIKDKASAKMGLLKGTLALSTAGLSLVAEKALENSKNNDNWYTFDKLLSYDVIMDGMTITTGGIGKPLIGGALFGSTGAIAGGLVGNKKERKKVSKLSVKVTIDDFRNPCTIIDIINKPMKTGSKDYSKALDNLHEILSVLENITHHQ